MLSEREFLEVMKEYIEKMEVTAEGEFGYGRGLADLIASNEMPPIYNEVLWRLAFWRITDLGLTIEQTNPGEWRVIGKHGATLLHTTDMATLVLFSETFGGGQLPSATPDDNTE